MSNPLIFAILESHRQDFSPVVPFNSKKQKISSLDLSGKNENFTEQVFSDTGIFSDYIKKRLSDSGATYLVGGYREDRVMYRRSQLFDKNLPGFESRTEEPRSLHLGIDIWGPAGTTVFAPLGGMVHSFAFNNNHGDYGATIILQHQLDAWNFYTLYGHLSLNDIGSLREGQFISRGESFAHFGVPAENGNWPPHLHFQVILDMDHYVGDYPGVCKPSEAQKYLDNCPNPDIILQLNQYIQ